MTAKPKILITGAGGFIGYQLANDLARRGHPVVGVDRQYPPDAGPSDFTPETLDFRDSQRMEALLEGTAVVFHLASAHLKINLDEQEYWNVNVRSLPPLLRQVKEAGVERFIQVSSVGIYGNLTRWPADEETPCRPQSIYGETKLAGEDEVRRFSLQEGLPTVILRPAWVYGPTCPRTRKLYRALRKGRFVMIGPGRNWRHPIYIADLLQAFRLAMEKEAALGETVILGGEKALTTADLIRAMCAVFEVSYPRLRIPYWSGQLLAAAVEETFRLLKTEPPLSRRTLEFFETNNVFDISKARGILDFSPRYTFAEGLRECRREWDNLANETKDKQEVVYGDKSPSNR